MQAGAAKLLGMPESHASKQFRPSWMDGLEHVAEQSRRIYRMHQGKTEPELRALVLNVIDAKRAAAAN
jgi:hypothetical protein